MSLPHFGLNLSDAIRLFLRQIVVTGGLPFEIKAPNAATQAAMLEARQVRARYATAKDRSMNSKASGPRPRKSGRTRKFKQDWKRLQRSGRYPMEELKFVMRLVIENAGPLPAEYVDHPLQGEGAITAIATFAVTGC